MKTEQAVQSYLLAKQLQNVATSTIEQYESKLNRLGNWSDDPDVANITGEDVRSFLAGMTNCGNVTKGIYIKIYRTFFTWLQSEGIIKDNPMKNIPMPKVQRNLNRRVLSREELNSLMETVIRKPRDFAIISLLSVTGLRVSELCNLDLADIDWEEKTIQVRDGKGGKDRSVFFNPIAARAIRRYLAERPESESPALFLSTRTRDRMERCAVGRMIKRNGERAGIKGKQVCPHALRHTFATQWFCNHGDPQSLKEIMGWTTTRMADHYVHLALENIHDIYNRVVA